MQMLPDFGIVFLHHRKDEVTLNNLATFREWNPGVPLVTVSGSDERIEGGYVIGDFPEEAEQWRRHTGDGKLLGRSADLLVYAWHRHRRERARYWVLVEWDAYCGMPLSDFYAPVRDHDLVAPTVRWLLREPEWNWFRERWTLPEWMASKAVGVMPFCFLRVADAVLDEMVRLVPWDQLGRCNSELRFGSLAHAAGFIPTSHPSVHWNIGWQPLREGTPIEATASVWHPVKWLAPRREPAVCETRNGTDSPFGVAVAATRPRSPFRRRPSLREPHSSQCETADRPVSVVTLWRAGWNESQQAVLDWLVGEAFPVGSQFIWTVVLESETEEILAEAWDAMEAHGREYAVDLIEVPAIGIRSELERHQVVAQLYDEALRSVEHGRVLFLEDDVVPEEGAFAMLSKAFSELASDAALVGACYESRTRPHHWCASETSGEYIKIEANPTECRLTEVGWVGGGMTLYRTDELLRARPFHATAREGWVKGWDVNLCERLRRRGLRLFLHTGARAEHRFGETIATASDAK